MSGANVELDMIQGIRRHRNLDFIWDVQNSGALDIDVLRAADCLILKEPSALQSDFERPALRKRYERAGDSGVEWSIYNAYVYTHRKEFVLEEIKKPPYWNEEISTDDIQRKKSLGVKIDEIKDVFRW